MSWNDAHRMSEELASEAHVALRIGDSQRAQALFLEAAEAEEHALSQMSPADKPRTFGITAVSTVALWYKGGDLSRAEVTANRVLARGDALEVFAVEQLRQLLQTIRSARAQPATRVNFDS